MSKEAAVRAMREARYKERSAASTPATKPARAASRPTKAPAADPVAPEAAAAEGLCGHRSMNGRSCTREHGHAAKSHRYS
jgi:hypothetical protein